MRVSVEVSIRVGARLAENSSAWLAPVDLNIHRERLRFGGVIRHEKSVRSFGEDLANLGADGGRALCSGQASQRRTSTVPR